MQILSQARETDPAVQKDAPRARPRIIQLPKQNSRQHELLRVLLGGPGTFYQVCERAGFDIDPHGAEGVLRELFDSMVRAGTARVDGIIYSITHRAQVAFELLRGAPPMGEVAAPHFRGTRIDMPVRIVRRPPAPNESNGRGSRAAA